MVKIISTYEDGSKISEVAICDCSNIGWLDILIGFLGALVVLYFMVM